MNKRRKIKILFDAGPLVNGQKSGVGYYTHGLVTSLAKAYPQDIELVGHYFNFLGRKTSLNLPQAENIRYRKTILYPGKVPNFLRRLGLPVPFEIFTKEKGDFHLFPNFLGWPSIFGTTNTAVIHDLSFLEHPEYVSARNQKDLERFVPQTIKRASFIIANSEATKQKIEKHYPAIQKKIVITYIPPSAALAISPDVASKILDQLGIKKEYLLFMGTLEPRKNIVGLLRAYEQLDKKIRDTYSLVLAGGKGWNDEEIIQTITDLKARNFDIVQTGYISDEQRAALYSKASTYILPSHYEGFGMPVLEAMTYHLPVAVSDIPVLHEVASDAAVYFNPNDPEDIASKMQAILENKSLRKELIDKSKDNLRRFNWGETAQVVYDAIEASVD